MKTFILIFVVSIAGCLVLIASIVAMRYLFKWVYIAVRVSLRFSY
jgi:hypothetical protein